MFGGWDVDDVCLLPVCTKLVHWDLPRRLRELILFDSIFQLKFEDSRKSRKPGKPEATQRPHSLQFCSFLWQRERREEKRDGRHV